MATTAGTKMGGKRPGKKKPVTAHPLFSAYVAIWFAALLGLSSLALGTINIERLVVALQLQQWLPAAAPPLGMKARALIAVALAVIGAVLGFALASRFTPKKAPAAPREPRAPIQWPSFKRPERPAPAAEPPVAVRARDTHPDAPVRRPIFAHEEFGQSGEPEDAEAVEDMETLRAARIDEPEVVDLVLPSFLVAARKVPFEAAPAEPEIVISSEVPESGDTAESEEPFTPQFLRSAESEFAVTLDGEWVEAQAESASEPEAHDEQPAFLKPVPPAPFDLQPGEAAGRIASADLTDLSPVELLERFAIALQHRQERAGVPLSTEQAARVKAIGEAALALGREAIDELDRAPKLVPVDQPKGVAVLAPKASAAEAEDSDETEKALRDALAALQRMTGTA